MRSLAMTLCALNLAACQNYTTKPLCTDDNAVMPPGITGIYTVSQQDEEFNVTTEEFEILFREDAAGALVRRGQAGNEEELRLCSVGGHVVEEALDEDVGAYHHRRLYVTNMGLTYLPVMFDRASLDAAGVPYKIFEMPASYRVALGARFSSAVESLASRVVSALDDGEASYGLMIDNAGVSNNTVATAAHAGPFGVTFLRK